MGVSGGVGVVTGLEMGEGEVVQSRDVIGVQFEDLQGQFGALIGQAGLVVAEAEVMIASVVVGGQFDGVLEALHGFGVLVDAAQEAAQVEQDVQIVG